MNRRQLKNKKSKNNNKNFNEEGILIFFKKLKNLIVPLNIKSKVKTRNKFKKIISKLFLKKRKFKKKTIKRKKNQFGNLKFLKVIEGL